MPAVICKAVIAGRSKEPAAGGDRPYRLDAAISNSNVPIVKVHCRIAMAGDQHQFFIQLGEHAREVGFKSRCKTNIAFSLTLDIRQ